MNHDQPNALPGKDERSKSKKAIDAILKTGAFFIMLEPIWMLLPFAGFLYGSVMHIQQLSNNPNTAWLVHFVLPTHTLFPLGLLLMGTGLCVFLVGAFQIYSAKLFKKGLVKTGIYRKFRHPQYLSLTLFGLGIILTWGRFITYIAFFVMMWLYYFLSKNEERQCRALFGKQYDQYRKNTYFLFPGERVLVSVFRKIPGNGFPTWINAAGSLVLVVALSIGSGFLLQGIKRHWRATAPTIEGSVSLSPDGTQKVKLIMVKGPVLQAAPIDSAHHQYSDKAYEMLISSAKIKQALNQLRLEEHHTLLAFLTPGSNWHSGAHRNYRTVTVNAFMVLAESVPEANAIDALYKDGSIKFLKSIRAQELCYGRLEKGHDPTEGMIIISGPPAGNADPVFQKRMQERINFFMSGM